MKWGGKKIMKKTKTDFKMMMLLPFLFYQQVINDTVHIIPCDTSHSIHSFIESPDAKLLNSREKFKHMQLRQSYQLIRCSKSKYTWKKPLNKYISIENRKLKDVCFGNYFRFGTFFTVKFLRFGFIFSFIFSPFFNSICFGAPISIFICIQF